MTSNEFLLFCLVLFIVVGLYGFFTKNKFKMIEVKSTDKLFQNSPDAGDKNCLCSRCGKQVPAKDAPIIRVFMNEGHSGEYRYCRVCSEGMGFKYL